MKINLPDKSIDEKIKELIKGRDLIIDLEIKELERDKREDIRTIDEEIERLRNQSSLK